MGLLAHFQNVFVDILWRSTPVQVTDPMTGRTGNVREVVLDWPTWIRQLEVDVGLTADAGWNMAGDRKV